MADLFGGLGNLGGMLGGLAKTMVPKDTPEGKLLGAQSELADLQKQESDILLEIGKQAYAQNPSAWQQDAKLKLIRQNIQSAEAVLSEAKQAQEKADAERAAEDAKNRCPNCGHKNDKGVRFCQECGTEIAATPKHCVQCGAEIAAGIRFCGQCGANQGD